MIAKLKSVILEGINRFKMPPKKVFPRGGNVVSKGQKNKKMMDKVKKQQGKKADLFSEKRVFKGMITKELKEKFKDHKKAKTDHLPEVAKQNMNEIPLGKLRNFTNAKIFEHFLKCLFSA